MIGRRLGGVAVGIVAGVLWSIYPMGAFISGIVYPTTLLTILLAGGVLCLVTNPYDNKYPARVCLAGLLFGLSAMAKPIVLGTIICVAFWFALRRSSDRVLLVSIFLLTTLMALMPWSVRNAFVHDRLVPIESRGLAELVPWAEAPETVANNKTKAVATVKHGFATPPSKPMVNEQPEVLAQPNKNQVWGQFTRMAKRFPREFMSFFEVYPRRVGYLKQGERDRALKDNPQLVRYTIFGSDLVMAVSFLSVVPLFITALIGMCVMYKNRDNRHKLVLLGLMIMSFALGYATSWGKIRYRIPVDPYIIILSAWGVVYLWNTVVKKPALHIE
jgi:4-amino-4-deoxy-L-arabinose transferase-like glycosyltransferase